jgi:RNA polymerase sigma-70 factor (ECF subfamily)
VEARQVVAAVLDGDRDAFRILVEREAGPLVRSCHRILGDINDAEDAAQEAFVTAYRALGTWRGDGRFGAWLARIGMRIAVRKASRRRPIMWIDPAPAAAGGGRARVDDAHVVGEQALVGTPGRAEQDPAQIALRSERAAAVRAAVANLDEPYREVIALRFFSELSLAEISNEVGRPLGTVKTHLHRGLARLRRALEEQEAAS